MGGDSSTSGGELEAGELVIDDSYTHLSKKKKKSKKSKKKKEKEKDRAKDKSSKEKKHSKGGSTAKKGECLIQAFKDLLLLLSASFFLRWQKHAVCIKCH